MSTRKVTAAMHRYQNQATASKKIHITTAVYSELPEHNLAALKRLLKKGYTVQLTLN